ncbi:MAG: HAD family hydrolase [Phycisphaerales bacterium]|nr:HAD family hydrolase [Phycisphaerales bacterium]
MNRPLPPTAPLHALDGLFVDMYGTLAAGDRAAVEAVCARVVADTDLPLTPQDLAIRWGNRFFAAMERAQGPEFCTLFTLEARTLSETLAELGCSRAPEPYVDALRTYWRAPPFQPELEAFLADLPLPICMVSNADHDDLLAALAAGGIRAVGVVTSESARTYKPDPAIFEAALAETGWRRERVLHVGDSLHSDIAGARRAGLRSVWIHRTGRIHDIGTAEPDWTFSDLLALRHWLITPESTDRDEDRGERACAAAE